MLGSMAGAVGAATGAYRALDTAALRLLRANNMPVIVATCGRHLVDRRIIAYPEFVTLVADDLSELRDEGIALPRTAQEYIADWIRDGILIRRATAARDESIELSPTAADAIAFLDAIDRPVATVTSSRLANVSDLLASLARDTDPDPSTRIAALQAERDRLDAEIARVESEGSVPADDAAASERLAEILRLAEAVPRDFAKVADSFERLNQGLREQIINHEGQRGEVLDEIFAGVDLIESSDAGRTFDAFYRLLLDPELVERFDASVDAVLDRDFAADLPLAGIAFLRQYLTTLQSESAQVRGTLTDLSRSLRRFVETQEYREQQRLATAINTCEQALMGLLHSLPTTHKIGVGLDLTSMRFSSIGSWALHNPADVRTAETVDEHDTQPLNLENLRELVRLTEIDFGELHGNVAAVVDERATATVGEVLERFPASQGLASIVGLLVLAVEYAIRVPGSEVWTWQSRSGRSKNVSGPRYLFSTVPADWTKR